MSQVFYRRPPRWTYPEIVRAEGVYLYDRDGRRYLDAAGGALVVSVGHGVAEIAEAIRDQIGRLAQLPQFRRRDPGVRAAPLRKSRPLRPLDGNFACSADQVR